ncbi:MAG: hypothetical protein WCR95_08660, partial [Eubacteriales bacterium]
QALGIPCLATEGVVPKEVDITGLLQYVPLDNNPDKWAVIALEAIKRDKKYYQNKSLIEGTAFDIKKEALVLEKALFDCANA